LSEEKGDYNEAVKLYGEGLRDNASSWEPYYKLGTLLVKMGEIAKASETFNNYPPFKDNSDQENLNMVALSNYAYNAGSYLLWSGAFKEAVPLLKRSVSYNTGSGAEMDSTYLLEILDKKYLSAAQVSLEGAKRYGQTTYYTSYIRMLHALGFHKEAWSVWNSLDLAYQSRVNWDPVILGQNMEMLKEQDQVAWLVSLDKVDQRLAIFDAQNYIFLSHLVDRAPNADAAETIETIDYQFEHYKAVVGSRNVSKDRTGNNWKPGTAGPVSQKTYLSLEARIADAYYHLRTHDDKKAYDTFKELIDKKYSKNISRMLLPFLARSGLKTSNISAVASYIEAFRKQHGPDFYYHLTMVFLHYGKGSHKKALESFDRAQRFHIEALNQYDGQGFPPLYQLIEACEWLYEDSGNDVYRDRALKLAQLYQNLKPETSWLYAVEAKLARTEEARLRPLALTLYLDPRSERISAINESEKDKAKEWLKKNSPFIAPDPDRVRTRMDL
jgi:tetratricopeptide (TPR) repeat protein